MAAVHLTSALLVCLAAASAVSAAAEPKSFLTLSGMSYHLDRSREYNEMNSGAGLERRFSEEFALVGGFYRNSMVTREAVSTYGGVQYSPIAFGPVRAGAMIGFVTGYKRAPVLPAASAVVSIGGRDEGLNIHFLPSTDVRTLSAIALQLKRAF